MRGRWTKIIVILNALAVLCWGTTALAAEQPKLAFVRGGNIWIAASDGAQARQLTHSHQDGGPAVSPDGKWVAYYSGRGEETGFGQIFLIPAAGGLVQQFRHPEVQGGEHPAFSPDGKTLLFVGLSDLKVLKTKGSESVQATMSLTMADLGRGGVRRLLSHPNTNLDTGYMYSNPAFAPDGRLIAYQESGSDVSGGFAVIDLNRQEAVQIPPEGAGRRPVLAAAVFPGRPGDALLCARHQCRPGGHHLSGAPRFGTEDRSDPGQQAHLCGSWQGPGL